MGIFLGPARAVGKVGFRSRKRLVGIPGQVADIGLPGLLALVVGAVLVLGLVATPTEGLAVAQGLKDQLRHVELMHVSHTKRRSLGWDSATFAVEFLNMSLVLHLKHNEELFMHNIEATLVGADGVHRPFAIDRENYWIGSVQGDPSSQVALYISPKGFFHGHIYTQGEEYILEQAFRHYNASEVKVDEYTVVYRARDLINKYDPHSAVNESGHSFCGIKEEGHNHAHDDHDHDLETDNVVHSHRLRRAAVSNTFNYCLMTVVADSGFFSSSGGSTAAATSAMLNQISVASQNFKTTNWYTTTASNVVFSNLQLSVKRVIVYSTTSSDPYYQSGGYPGPTGPQTLLTLFSSAPGITGGWNTCLAHLFTHYSFSGGTLGLAWVGDPAANRAGGVCHASANTWLNTGWTTNVNNGVAVPTIMNQLVTQHEIGHNWGSPHDTAGAECLGGSSHYNMYPTAVDGSSAINYQFSPCSIRNMTLVLQAKGSCFSSSPSGFCGDYTVQTNISETCDSGPDGDKCCFGSSASALLQCKFNGSATCSDTTDICCRNCQPSSSIQCFKSFLNDPQCRANTTCSVLDAKNCPAVPPKTYGEPCGSGGICNGQTSTSASCVSFCSRFGAASCRCASPNECRLCCIHQTNLTQSCNSPFKNYNTSGVYQCTAASVAMSWVTNSTCLTQPYWTARLGTPILYNATQRDPACTASSCWGILDYIPNTVCSIGVCDATATCVEQSGSTAYSWATLSSLSLDSAAQWMKRNIVGTVLIFSFIVWLPLGCLVHRSDVKQRQNNVNYGVRQSSTMTFRPKDLAAAGARRPGARY